ncbi:MAG: gamma-glutamylcyclotransferase [Pseudomonadota bacterium]|nr:gamma-glutamylcyclotransferase [Pseudomonadota bacterium]
MILYFAYGSNMDRLAMAKRCPQARPLGIAVIDGYRFTIGADGYASLVRAPGNAVHGVLWHLTPRDLAALDAYESIDTGLYRRAVLPVRFAGRTTRALLYLGRRPGQGRPRGNYLQSVIAAARDWKLPRGYIARLGRCAPRARTRAGERT